MGKNNPAACVAGLFCLGRMRKDGDGWIGADGLTADDAPLPSALSLTYRILFHSKKYSQLHLQQKKPPCTVQDGEGHQSSKRSQICLPAATPAMKACTTTGTGNIGNTSFQGIWNRTSKARKRRTRGNDAGTAASCTYLSPPLRVCVIGQLLRAIR